jgi:hypothetical protein
LALLPLLSLRSPSIRRAARGLWRYLAHFARKRESVQPRTLRYWLSDAAGIQRRTRICRDSYLAGDAGGIGVETSRWIVAAKDYQLLGMGHRSKQSPGVLPGEEF